MAVSFPASPANNQVYIDNTSGSIYIYNSTSNKWISDVAPFNAGLSSKLDYGLITGSITATIDYGSIV